MMKVKALVFLLAASMVLFLNSCKKDRMEDEVMSQADQALSAQQAGEVRTCATEENFQAELAKDPGLGAKMEQIEQAVQRKMALRSTLTGTVTIPVVVHVLYNTTAQNISDAQIYSQIDVLNKDFARTNTDAVNTPSAFQSVAAGTNIQFTLAKRDPSGNPTTGIIRKYCTQTSWSANGSMKLSSMGGDDAWPCTSYLNIWVCALSGSLGYTTYPGGNPVADGVVIRTTAFGNTGYVVAPYHLGRTATHEVAHWLNIYHIWGDAACGDDMIYDTPTQQTSNYGCPAYPHLTCSNASSGDQYMNYMDYTNDACMNMFTAGQASRMAATLQVARASILTSLGGVPLSGGTTTCNTPSGLASSSISQTGAVFSWASSGAGSYNVRYKPTASTTWVNTSTTATSFTASGLTASTAYEFQVQGNCGGTLSAFSSSATFTTLTPVVTCNVPGGLLSSSILSVSATLSWGSTGAISYNVRYKPTLSSTWTTASTAGTTLPISGLTALTTYEFQVQSVCSGGTSAYSASGTFVTLAAASSCNVPGSLSASSITTSSATVSWGSTGAVSYYVRYKPTASTSWSMTSTSATAVTLQGLAASTSYEFQVQSVCSGGSSAYSGSATFTTATPVVVCNIPAGLFSSSITSSSATANWGATGAVSYNIRYKPTTSATWLTTTSTTASRGLTGLAASTVYEFQVQSVCSGGSSAYSGSATFATAAAAVVCNVPGSISTTSITSSSATVSWGATGAISYNIRYRAYGTTSWITVTSTSPSRILSGLSANTTYEVQVQSSCSGGTSAFSASGSFTTARNGNGKASRL